jgi:hypothetical protein
MDTKNTGYRRRFGLGSVARKVATTEKVKATSLQQHQKENRRLVRREEEKQGSSKFTELTSVVSFSTRRRSRALAQRTSIFVQLGVACMFLGILWRSQPPFCYVSFGLFGTGIGTVYKALFFFCHTGLQHWAGLKTFAWYSWQVARGIMYQ